MTGILKSKKCSQMTATKTKKGGGGGRDEGVLST